MCGIVLISGCGMDIVFLIDSSGSIGQYNFDKIVSSIDRAIRLFNLDYGSAEHVRIGIATFNDANYPQKQLNEFLPLYIPYIPTYLNGRTDISVAIK